MSRKALLYQRRILLQFPFNMELIKTVKGMKGAEFKNKVVKKKPNGKLAVRKNVWMVDCDKVNIKLLKEMKFEVSDKVVEGAEKDKLILKEIGEIEGLKATLYPYQKESLSFLEAVNGRGLLALDAGLGKTISSIAYTQMKKDIKKILIICPSCVKILWKREFKKWVGKDAQTLNGRTPYKIDKDVVVVNYDVVDNWSEVLKKEKFDIIVMDEVHYLANQKSKRSKAIKKISKGVDHVIGLSGTPFRSKPSELFNPLQIINKGIFPDRRSYERRYCGAFQGAFGWDASGASNLKELSEILRETVMIRKRKQDVLKDLPTYQETIIPIKIDRSEYDVIENDFAKWLEANKKTTPATVLTQISPLRMECLKKKLPSIINWIDDFLSSGEKLVVFGVHKIGLSELMKKYSKIAVKIDGSLSAEKKQKAVDKFMNDDECKIVFGNIQSIGTGTDGLQTVCNNALFIEDPWNPSDKHQAISRLVRIKQRFSVNIYRMMAEYTFDYHVKNILDKKQIIVDKVIDGNSDGKIQKGVSLISELTKTFSR